MDESRGIPPTSPPSRQTSIQWHQRQSKLLSVRDAVADLPAGPSMRQLDIDDDDDEEVQKEFVDEDNEMVAVFNSNSPDGNSMVRALASQGTNVVAIVRVFTSKLTKSLLDLDRVTVKVADLHDEEDVYRALKGVKRAFLCLKYWERFDTTLEETQANLILKACAASDVKHLVFSSFEDTKQLRNKGLKSQIVPDSEGRIHPKFDRMKSIKDMAKEKGIHLTHMITSYLDQETSKKSLCLIVGENGKLIVQPHIKGEDE